MRFSFLANKSFRIVIIVLGLVMQVANAFIGNIISFDQSGVHFSLSLLLGNKWFWFYIVILVSYTLVSILYSNNLDRTDKRLEGAYADSADEMLHGAARFYAAGDFESGDKLIDRLNMIENYYLLHEKQKRIGKRRDRK